MAFEDIEESGGADSEGSGPELIDFVENKLALFLNRLKEYKCCVGPGALHCLEYNGASLPEVGVRERKGF